MPLGVAESQLLLDALDGDGFAEEVLFTIRVKGYVPTMAPTATQELYDMATVDRDITAMSAFSMLSRTPDHTQVFAPELEPVPNGHAALAADELFEKGLVPNKNIGLIVAEASGLKAKFVTFDDDIAKHLDSKKINEVLSRRDLATVPLLSWSDVLQKL